MAPMTLTAAEINEAVYVALAGAGDDLATEVVAGITGEMLRAHPGLPEAAIRAAIGEVNDAVTANRPDPARDLSPDTATRLARILVRVVPALTRPEARDGAARYTRAFMRACRPSTDRLRQVAPLALQFDRVGEVARFRRQTWQGLYRLAAGRAAVRRAVDEGPIGAALNLEVRLGAAALLERVPVQPLRDFVLAHLRADGALVVDSAEVDPLLADVGRRAAELRDAYAANLVEINRAEERERQRGRPLLAAGGRSRTVPAGAVSAAAGSDFLEALEKAKKKLAGFDKDLPKIRDGVKSTLGVVAFLVGTFDEEFAADITEYATISVTLLNALRELNKAALSTAEFLAGLVSASRDDLLLGGGLAFSFAMVALLVQVTGLLGGRAKPINQVILEELRKVSRQITELRDEMRVRFDRIETKLAEVYAGLLEQLAEIDFTLGEIRGDVGEIQLALYNLHAEVQRLNRDVHGFLEAGHRRDLVEAINGFLDFAESTGEPLDFPGFRTAENVFFTWGRDHAKDALQAGPPDRAYSDDDLARELTSLPMATNVNYLREVPAEMFDLPALAPDRLANPFDWIVAAEAYAQLSEESPDHAGRISPSRVQDLVRVGETLGTSLSRIADAALFCHLLGHYQRVFTRLKATIDTVERGYRADESENHLFGVDLWGGPDQEPNRHFFETDFARLRRCDGRNFDDSHDTVPTAVYPFDHGRLRPFMIASNLSTSKIPGAAAGLSRLSACVQAIWRTIGVEDTGFGGMVRVTYRLSILVHVRYGGAVVFTHRFDTPEQFMPLVRRDDLDTFDPVTDPGGKNPYPLLVGAGKSLWSKLETFPSTHSVVNPALHTATADLVAAKLRLVQRAFYAEVARLFAADADQVRILGTRLDGSKLLWQAMVAAGLPLSVEANEILRGLLFGSEAILGGTGGGPDATGLDSVRGIYAHFSTRPEDPLPTNILPDIKALAEDRMNRLATLVLELVDAQNNGGEPQPPELFAPTLLRLGLLAG